jgi:hypothetical protein
MRTILIMLFLGWVLMPGWSQVNGIDWEEDCQILLDELYSRHPDLFFQADSADFTRDLARLAGSGNGLTEFSMAVKLQQLLVRLGDEHTSINYMYRVKAERILPMTCYWFEDGIHVTRCPVEHAPMLGKKLMEINGHPVKQIIDSLATLIPGQSPARLLDLAPRMLTWTQLLEHFKFAEGGEVILSLEDENGGSQKILLKSTDGKDEILRVRPEPIPLGWEKQHLFFHDSLLAEEGIYYLQYNRCWSREAEKEFGSGAEALFMPSIEEFEENVLEVLKKEKIRGLVLDLRFNTGGNPIQGTRLIKKISRSRTMKSAEAYLLVGRKTAAAALVNASDFTGALDPLVIGEDSGGKPNHFGEMIRLVLPASGLVFNCSTRYLRTVEGDPPAFQPGVSTTLSFSEYMNGTDPALERVRQHLSGRSQTDQRP